MEFDRVVARRRMVRAYQERPVEGEKLWKILRNAHGAPSAGFLQPVEFIIVKDQGTKAALAEAAREQGFVAEAPVVLVVCSDTRRQVSRYGRRAIEFYSITDGAFAALLAMLTAVNEGLGCCFVGAFDDEAVSRVLRLPNGVRPIGVMPLGYPADRPERYQRRPLERIIHYDQW